MQYSEETAFARKDKPLYEVTIWPNRSLGRIGFRNTLILVSVGMAIPIIPFLFSPIGWALLPFGLLPVILTYVFIKRNYWDGRLTEELRLWQDLITIERTEPNGDVKRWFANPYWIKTMMHDKPVENYFTIKGNNREIEVGAFLSPEERISLKIEIDDALRGLDINRPTLDM